MARAGSVLMQRGWLRAPTVDAARLDSMRDWFPVALDDDSVSWRHLPGRFTEPFFADSLRAQPHAQRRVCVTPHAALGRVGACLVPSALLFHCSRCGSTLLAQLLASLPHCIVQSEPPVLDDFLARYGDDDPGVSAPLLRQLVLALGQRRAGASHYIVKLDAWHIRHLALLRAAFPATPFWFLYREPGAVLASHTRQRGPQMVPGLVLPASFGADIAPGDLDAFCAAVLHHFFSLALAHADTLRLLDYRQLPALVWDELLPALGIPADSAQLAGLRERARFHAKAASTAFAGDPPAQTTTAPHLLEMLAPLYAQLEALRVAAAEEP